ncbi:hypothetical protein VE03_03095 [Pseudogymnoascus sp. 23342-1-I1]|nr:hypothetical protein VE03_03095 [Pseudogymnoascus sp. 23342-1-I1]
MDEDDSRRIMGKRLNETKLQVFQDWNIRSITAAVLGAVLEVPISTGPLNSYETTQPAKSLAQEVPAEPVKVKVKAKTIAELDEELKLKLEGISGEGGAAGLEYEDGKAVAMKRGVKENMFSS